MPARLEGTVGMIQELSVDHLAIIDRAELSFESGFTALTGETGAGKSLLIDALQLALGARADSDLVRHGCPRATVRMVVRVDGSPNLLSSVKALGLEGNEIVIQREVLSEGKSICRINGRTVPAATLRTLGALLVDLHGQHDHQALLDPARHVEYLDAWIGEPAQELKAAVNDQYLALTATQRRIEAFHAGNRAYEQRLDLLRYQINEIESAEPIVGELEEAETKLQRLKFADRLMESISEALLHLTEGEENAEDHLSLASKALQSGAKLDEALDPALASIQEISILANELSHTLNGYRDALESNPDLLDASIARIDLLRRLRKKYGEDEAEVLAFLATAKLEIEELEAAEQNEDALIELCERQEMQLLVSAEALSSLRKERSLVFAHEVQTALTELALERAIFETAFARSAVNAGGCDQVDFYFSANLGEPPRPLARIASGGELSRVMLAMKTVFAGKAGVPTLIFDEVDAGLGGQAAAAVAKRLRMLAKHYQVLVISHLPQIASQAQAHFRIAKLETDGRVVATVTPLEGEERVMEIARMVAGEQVTDSAIQNARDLLGSPALLVRPSLS